MKRRAFAYCLALSPLASGCGGEPPGTLLGGGGPDGGPSGDAGEVPDGGSDPALVLGPYLCDPRPDAVGFFIEGAFPVGYAVVVTPAGGGAAITVDFELDGYRIGRVDVTGLLPDTAYVYEITYEGAPVAGGAFRTLPDTRASFVRLAIGADIHPTSKPYVVFDRIRERSPHAFLAIGDQVYADRTPTGIVAATEAAYRGLYPIAWDDPALAACWAEVPTMLMWDDHEIIDDYDGGYPARFAAALAAYDAYQGVRNRAPQRPGELYYQASLGPIDLFVLDTRSHRDPNDAPDVAGKTMLGATQLQDLMDWLLASDAPAKLIVSPTPFHPYVTTGTDAWAYGFLSERAALFDFIATQAIDGVVLVSGDQHWPAVVVQSIGPGRTLTELQCTPVAAYKRKPPVVADPEVLYLGTGAVGFGLVEVDGTAGVPTLRFAWVRADGVEDFVTEVALV